MDSQTQNIEKISEQRLKEKLDTDRPNNQQPSEGFALVNVLAAEQFEQAHIPDSINI